MNLSVYSYTNPGGRLNNEDAVLCDWNEKRGVFTLADGLGGHRSGEVASGIAVRSLLEDCMKADMASQETLETAFLTANQAVLEGQSAPDCETMKTTAVTLILEDGRACWGHIGDSRLYHFSGGTLADMTQDHSVTYQKYLGGEISYMDICHDDDRSSLLRVLGKQNCRPSFGACEIKPGDAFLLCTDGFWEFVYNEEMLLDRLKASTPDEWAKLMLLRHIRRIPPETDNFSLITVFVED